MYQLRECDFNGNKKDNIKNITDDLGDCLIKNMQFLGTNMRSYYYYQIVKRNLQELIIFINSQQNKVDNIDAIECNRFLYNFLDTFYSYVQYLEKKYTQEFSIVKSNIYDQYFEYRLLYNLRNYIIHDDLAILTIEKLHYKDNIKVKFIVDKLKLEMSDKINKKFKKELNKIDNKNIDIFEIVNKFQDILKILQIEMLKAIYPKIKFAFSSLREQINESEVFLLKDDQIKNGLLNVLNKFYKDLAYNFIYDEDLLKQRDINEIFMELSFLYYKEKGVAITPLIKK